MADELEPPASFPRPGTLFHSMIYKTGSRNSYIRMFKIANMLVVPLYRSRALPLLGMGGRLLLLQTKGRKSGKTRYNPVEYFRIDGKIHIFSGWGERANWVRNIRAKPDDFFVQAGFQRFHANAVFIESDEEKRAICVWMVTEHAAYSKTAFGWRPKEDDPKTADFSPIMQNLSFIRIEAR